MTEPKKINRRPSENQELVSFRLPSNLLQRLDETVELQGSSRTGVLRSAIATYWRLATTMLVPVTDETRQQLARLAEQQNRPAETIAAELFETAVDQTVSHKQKIWSSLTEVSFIKREPELMRMDLGVTKAS